jgi:hypothetical protein
MSVGDSLRMRGVVSNVVPSVRFTLEVGGKESADT